MSNLKPFAGLIVLAGLGCALASAQQQTASQPWSVRAANAAMERWPGGVFSPAGQAAPIIGRGGLLLEGIQAVWRNTVDRRDFAYIKRSVDTFVVPDSLPSSKPSEGGLAVLQIGRSALLLYGVTLDKRYYNLASLLSLKPERLPDAVPFHAEYAQKFHDPEELQKIPKQFASIEAEFFPEQPRDLSKRLPSQYRLERRASYMAALVDTIPYLSPDSAARNQLMGVFNRHAAEIARDQNLATGLWSLRLNLPSAAMLPGDVASSCLFIYALAKGVRHGYLPESYDAAAERGYQGILSHFVTGGRVGAFALHGTLSGPMEMGAFILASTEIENVNNAKIGRGDNVMVDGWFNSQKMKDATGQEIYFHYKWEEQSNPGYSLWGHAFRNFGARTTTLYAEPTFENMQPAQVYIIASPDNLDKNPHAHFANATDAKEIAKWVKAGGVLAIMENDTSFADLEHFNVVAEKFGIHFNSTLRMHVVGTDWAMGGFYIDGKGPIFHHPHTAYVKDVCTISVKPPAVPVYRHDKDIFMAEAKYGKGTVYAMVDPWFYNEYTNGLKLPAEYDNYAAGVELARWLLEQVPKPEGSGISGQGSGVAAPHR
jgi:unsaturated rhamnogalacturonyl hydrolase